MLKLYLFRSIIYLAYFKELDIV